MSRRVLVTGGSSGLGAALAKAFVARGDRVLIGDRNPPGGFETGAERPPQPPVDAERPPQPPVVEEVAQQPSRNQVTYLRLDVTSGADWESARQWVEREWGGLDVLVNNAGVAVGGRIDVCSMEEWQRAVDINLLGVVRGCQAFVPMMKQQGSGYLVNTASLAGLVHPPGMAAYTAVKAGVVALSETLYYELQPWGITTSAVCPSFFRTNIAQAMTGEDVPMGRIVARLVERSPLTADEIAATVLRGMDRKLPVIVTDAPARKAVRTKRLARRIYDREQRRFAGRIRALGEASEGQG